MCTLTFFPKSDGYVFTHNRDEHFLRLAAEPPQVINYKGLQVLFPRDGQAGGTWIAYHQNTSVCLINGAYEKHEHLPPYRLSRGIVLLDIFTFPSLEAFAKSYDLQGIEPFTAVVAAATTGLEELRWDGNKVTRSTKELMPTIWSSATLYSENVQKKREQLFQKFLQKNNHPSAEDIFHFHHTGTVGSEAENLLMQRPNGVKTLSISQIFLGNGKFRFWYEDMVNPQTFFVENETQQ